MQLRRQEIARSGPRIGAGPSGSRGPVLILTIANGAGHTRAAEAVASALSSAALRSTPALIVDVADYMTRMARFTHVTAYLWLVKHAPAVWGRIDRYQKGQDQTSPEWYYRRGCHRLFELARELRPSALVATEVGCCEIASLIKRDLMLSVPLAAVNVNYDADRAWVCPEVDLYCAATEEAGRELIAHGAPDERVAVWGVPAPSGFARLRPREVERLKVCRWLSLDPQVPLVLIAGGSEGLGRIEKTTERLLRLKNSRPQLIVLTGRNEGLRRRCERLVSGEGGARLRVLGWTNRMPELMRAADLMVSKLGNTFDEAMAAELPLIALKPPPGSECVQYRLLNEWGIGRAVRTLDELVEWVARLLDDARGLDAMRKQARAHRQTDAAMRIARWLNDNSLQTVLRPRPVNEKLAMAWEVG